MRSVAKKTAIAVGVALLALQAVPVHHDNFPVDSTKTIDSVESMPPDLRTIIHRSCADCHSDQTRWPWYSYVAPASWIVASDVHEARRKMNFSVWGNYSSAKKNHEFEEICNEVIEGDMPDGKYAFIHRSARLSQPEREIVCSWTRRPHPH
jgi:Haem-binding domain